MAKNFWKTSSIILDAKRFSEKDILLTLLTERYGKITAIARGARSPKAKLKSAYSPLAKAYVEVREGKTFFTLSGIKIINSRKNLAQNFENFRLACALCETVKTTTKDLDENQNLYKLLDDCLGELENSNNANLTYCHSCVQVFSELGFLSPLKRCTQCGGVIASEHIHIGDNGLTCEECETHNHCNLDLAKVLLYLQNTKIGQAKIQNMEKNLCEDLLFHTKNLGKNFTQRELKSFS